MLMSDKNQNKPKQPTYYVYALIDPRNNQPFYIGKGKDDRVARHYYNWSSIDKINPHKRNKINKLKSLGYCPKYEILIESSNETLIFQKETELIAKWGRISIDKGGILTNINPGGEGNTGGQKSVKQYNLFGEYIQTFSSCLEAAKSCGKKGSSSIVECCKKNGNSKSTYGYFWSYSDEELDLEWGFGGKKKPVYQWDLEGNFVNRFINAYQAAIFIRKPNSSKEIIQSSKLNKQCQQFQWTFDKLSPGKYFLTKKSNPKCQEVYQFTIQGNFVKRHASFYDANISLNKKGNSNEISRAIRKKNGIAYGYKWSLIY